MTTRITNITLEEIDLFVLYGVTPLEQRAPITRDEFDTFVLYGVTPLGQRITNARKREREEKLQDSYLELIHR